MDSERKISSQAKKEQKKLMTETGTIQIENKTVGQQIDEILQLDETDPIRKLQLYFKGGHFGHEYTEEGVRIPKKYKAPRHKNYIM